MGVAAGLDPFRSRFQTLAKHPSVMEPGKSEIAVLRLGGGVRDGLVRCHAQAGDVAVQLANFETAPRREKEKDYHLTVLCYEHMLITIRW